MEKYSGRTSYFGVISCPYFTAFELNTEIHSTSSFLVRIPENTGWKKLRIGTLFPQYEITETYDVVVMQWVISAYSRRSHLKLRQIFFSENMD